VFLGLGERTGWMFFGFSRVHGNRTKILAEKWPFYARNTTGVMMFIREYKADDCPLLAQLFYDTVHTVNAKDYTKEQLDAWAPGHVNLDEWNHSFLEHTTLVAVWNGVIAGFADMDKSGYLDRLFVNKDYQGVGIAIALVTELERRVGQNSAVCFETYASVTAKPLFEKLGYTVQAENIAVRRGVSLVNFRMAKVISET